jgi:PAS domain-containing protein
MSQQEIEVILTRQLATYLAMPIFVVGPDGTLLFYNEPAEAILGSRFDETGALTVDEWSQLFTPVNQLGVPLPPEERPVLIAVHERRPSHRNFWVKRRDQVLLHIEVTAFPLIGQADRYLGAVAIFWEAAQ